MMPNRVVFDFAVPPDPEMEQVAVKRVLPVEVKQETGSSSGSSECGVVDGAHAEEIVEEPSKCEKPKPKKKLLKNVRWAPQISSEDCLATSDV